MALPVYLAMTPSEFTATPPLSAIPAWMACHFSSSGNGLSNFPTYLPDGAMLIVNDQIPPANHSPDYIANQLKDFVSAYKVNSVLLDFQRDGCNTIVEAITKALSCPIGVTARYAESFPCAVFLPSPPLAQQIGGYFSRYAGREIWLELFPDTQTHTITKDSSKSQKADCFPQAQTVFDSEALFCRYCLQKTQDAIIFTLQRQTPHLMALLENAEAFGVSRGIGLFQEFI